MRHLSAHKEHEIDVQEARAGGYEDCAADSEAFLETLIGSQLTPAEVLRAYRETFRPDWCETKTGNEFEEEAKGQQWRGDGSERQTRPERQ